LTLNIARAQQGKEPLGRRLLPTYRRDAHDPVINFLKEKAVLVEESIQQVKGVVDTFDGLVYTGNSIHLQVRTADVNRFGLTVEEILARLRFAQPQPKD